MLRKILLHPFFIFPAFACLLFWPISFQILTLKNDALSYYYPVRTLISDALNNGELPLWTPFINLGYPLHADLQSGAWNPVIWIFAFLTKYSLYAFHLEFLFYIAFAGIGFYYLCRQMGSGKMTALTLGLAYAGSGFMVDSVQFFNCISAACYLPFMLLFFIKLLDQHTSKDALLLALFSWLMFTGGYPSIFIISIYSSIALWIYLGYKNENKKEYFIKSLSSFAIAGFAFVILCLPAAISFYNHLGHIERGGDQSLTTVLENSMNPSTVISLVSPFSTTAPDHFLNSSILMRSIYFGLVPLAFLVWGITTKPIRKGHFFFFFFAALVMLGFAWGEYFFLRQAGYYILPLMKNFRHPALFRLFFIFFILLATRELSQGLYQQKKDALQSLKRFVWLSMLVLAAIWIGMLFWKGIDLWQGLQSFANWAEKLAGISFAERFLLQGPVIILTLLFFYRLIRTEKIKLILVLVFAELLVMTQFNLPVTAVGAVPFAEMQARLNRNAVNFPLPTNLPIEQSIAPFAKPNFISNPLQFEKTIGRNDVFITPGNLINQDKFYYSSEKITAFKKPVIYFSDSSAKGYSTNMLQISKFSANRISLQANTTAQKELVYQQNYYPGWKCYIDELPVPIRIVHQTEMSVTVPQGKHTIEFRYEPRTIKTSFYLSIFSLVSLLSYLVVSSFVTPRLKKRQKAHEAA